MITRKSFMYVKNSDRDQWKSRFNYFGKIKPWMYRFLYKRIGYYICFVDNMDHWLCHEFDLLYQGVSFEKYFLKMKRINSLSDKKVYWICHIYCKISIDFLFQTKHWTHIQIVVWIMNEVLSFSTEIS